MNKIKILVSITILSLYVAINTVSAQEIYYTTKGKIQITGVLNDTTLIAVSDDVIILMNYETAKFELRLDKSTIKTGIDSLDKELKKLQGNLLIYEGKLGVDFVRTQSHKAQDFEVEGYLSCAPHYEHIIGKGHLEHISANIFSCLLNMSFHLNLKEINLNINLPGLSDEIQVEIIQSILKLEND